MVASARYQAPAVRYPVVRSLQLGGILLGLSALGLLVCLAWWRGADVVTAAAIAVLVAWAWATALAGRFWWRSSTGFLAWDGRDWTFDCPRHSAIAGALVVHLDLQHSLWVCLTPPCGAPLWLWLQKSQDAGLWMDLRRGLYSRPRPGAADNLAEIAGRTP